VVVALPAFLYGRENWNVMKGHERGTEIANTKFFRPDAVFELFKHINEKVGK
jgi:hypothetical protein